MTTGAPSVTPTRVVPTTTAVAAAPTTSVVPVAPPTTAAAPTVLMPAVVCMNLQVAQSRIQAAGVFFSRSTDATGKGRAQVLDHSWVVVAQNPAPDVPIGEGQAVLSVMKYGEPNPC
ncbi:calcium-binding protein [Nocardia sp. A7]|uniref:calcium-binding protein n=1 Tax=Nocardia sp. A7 TaxID=2789274 RepID=UPI003979144B